MRETENPICPNCIKNSKIRNLSLYEHKLTCLHCRYEIDINNME